MGFLFFKEWLDVKSEKGTSEINEYVMNMLLRIITFQEEKTNN